MEKCVRCNKGRYADHKLRDYQYRTPMGIVTIEGESTILKCTKCDATLISGETYEKWNHLILKGLCEKRGLLDAKELQFILSILPYSQNEIAAAMGKDRSTLTKYKTAANPIDRLFDFALRQIIMDFLAGNSQTIERLKQFFTFEGQARLRKVHMN
jgi:hypothetical protein